AFKHLGIEFGVCSAVPFCLKGFPPAPRRIDGISTYRNATVDTHYLPHALYFPWRLFVVGNWFSAICRWPVNGGIEHVLDKGVNTESRCPVHFIGYLKTRD